MVVVVGLTSDWWDNRNNPQPSPHQPAQQSRSKYCVSVPNQPLSIQLFVIIIEKGVKGFTLLTVIPLAYASHGIWQGSRFCRCSNFRVSSDISSTRRLAKITRDPVAKDSRVGINIFVRRTANPVFHLYLCIEPRTAWVRDLNSWNWFMFINHLFCILGCSKSIELMATRFKTI